MQVVSPNQEIRGHKIAVSRREQVAWKYDKNDHDLVVTSGRSASGHVCCMRKLNKSMRTKSCGIGRDQNAEEFKVQRRQRYSLGTQGNCRSMQSNYGCFYKVRACN